MASDAAQRREPSVGAANAAAARRRLDRGPYHRTLGSLHPLAQEHTAEGALCPRAAHHHRADGGAAVGRRLRVHGAALEHGQRRPLRGGDAGHRGADRRLQDLSAGRRPRATRAASPRSGSGSSSISCPRRSCRRPARSRSSRCSTRRCPTRSASRSAGRSGSTRSAALDRRDPHQARRHGHARVRAAQRRL